MLWIVATLLIAAEEKPPVTDEEIAKFAYDQKYKVPADFVKDHALADINKSLYFHQPGWFADDKAKAREIVQAFLDKPSGIAVRKIEEEKETPRSFDFRGGTIWFRIHKPGYFTWKGKQVGDVQFPQPPDGRAVEVGQFKVKPLTMQAVKDYAEYEWLIQFYNLNGAKVIKSDVKELKDTIVATLWTIGVVYGDFGVKDEITLNEVVWTVDKADGKATKSLKVVKMMTGKRN